MIKKGDLFGLTLGEASKYTRRYYPEDLSDDIVVLVRATCDGKGDGTVLVVPWDNHTRGAWCDVSKLTPIPRLSDYVEAV